MEVYALVTWKVAPISVALETLSPRHGVRCQIAKVTNSISTGTFVWLNQQLSHDYAGEEARAFSNCGCYPISIVDF